MRGTEQAKMLRLYSTRTHRNDFFYYLKRESVLAALGVFLTGELFKTVRIYFLHSETVSIAKIEIIS
ncbi:MAG: hypothetical protein DCC75_10855 [Proteobacteria bacterium]|nr:MAG: hypothetical protein DCC75_10855 [Pseudomonadota bacterium]